MAVGDLLRTGPFVNSTERVVSGLVHRFGRLDFVSDNTGAFAGSSFVPGGCVVPIGNVLIYMATIVPDEYPLEVLSDGCGSFGSSEVPDEALSDGCSSAGSVCDKFPDAVEVFMASEVPSRRPAVERGAGARDGAGGSGARVPNRLAEALDGLRTPITPGDNVATQAADLDAARLRVLEDAQKVADLQRQLEATVHEFNYARGLPPDGRRTHVRQRGRAVAAATGQDGQPEAPEQPPQ